MGMERRRALGIGHLPTNNRPAGRTFTRSIRCARERTRCVASLCAAVALSLTCGGCIPVAYLPSAGESRQFENTDASPPRLPGTETPPDGNTPVVPAPSPGLQYIRIDSTPNVLATYEGQASEGIVYVSTPAENPLQGRVGVRRERGLPTSRLGPQR